MANYTDRTVGLWGDCLELLQRYKETKWEFIHASRDYDDFKAVYNAWTGLCSAFGGFVNSVLQDNPAWFTKSASNEVQNDMFAAINDGNELMGEIRVNYPEYVDRYYQECRSSGYKEVA